MNESQVVELMKSSKSEDEWNANIETVKAAFDDNYPSFWYSAIVVSGVAREVSSAWGGDDKIGITVMRRDALGVPHASVKLW